MGQKYAKLSLSAGMVVAVERVRERLQRAAEALEAAGIAYTVVGGAG